METRGHYILVGAFVLIMLTGMFVSGVWLARAQFQREGQVYDIFFRGTVTGLSEGAPVRYKGVPIGRVVAIRLDPENVERIRVRIEVDTGTPIKEDAVASLELQGITGQAFVELSGGSNASLPVAIPKGHTYPVITSRPSQFEEVVANAPELLNRVIGVADRLNLVLSDENRAAITDSLKNLDALTGTLARRSGDVDRMIGDAATTLASLRDATQSASATLARFDKIITEKGGIADKLATTLDDFDRSAKNLTQVTGHLDGMLQDNRTALHDFTQRGLTDATQLVADARTFIAALNRIADQLDRDPARFLFGDRRDGYRPK
jgi:phospholipid/cholesterol/gamma-HCH transport system substrate-binding protein